MIEQQPLTDAEVSALKDQLLASMPSQGLIGNGSLRRRLGWGEERYWHIRSRRAQKQPQSGRPGRVYPNADERRFQGKDSRLVQECMMISATHVEVHPMRTIAFALFPQDEQDDFRSSCKRWRKNPDEFLVNAEEHDPPPGPATPIQRDVVVVHVPTGKARRYSASSGSSWNRKFDDDLQAVYFAR